MCMRIWFEPNVLQLPAMTTLRTPRMAPPAAFVAVEETIDLSTGYGTKAVGMEREEGYGGFSLNAWLSDGRGATTSSSRAMMADQLHRASKPDARYPPMYSAAGDLDDARIVRDDLDAVSVRSSTELRIGGYRARPSSASPPPPPPPSAERSFADKAPEPAQMAIVTPRGSGMGDARKLALLKRRDKTPPATPARGDAMTEGEAALARLADAQLADVAVRAGRLAKLDLSSQRSPPTESPSMPSPPQQLGSVASRTPAPAPVAQQLQALQMDQTLLNEITTLKLELMQARTKLSSVQRQMEHEQALRQRAEAALASANASAAAAAARHNQQLRARAQLPPVLVSPSKPRQQLRQKEATSTSTQTEPMAMATMAVKPAAAAAAALHSSTSSLVSSTTASVDVAQLLQANRMLLDSCSRPMRSAAILIQSLARGFLARQRLTARKVARAMELAAPAPVAAADARADADADADADTGADADADVDDGGAGGGVLYTLEARSALIKIQAHARGYRVRQEYASRWYDTMVAVTRMQKYVRGWRARRTFVTMLDEEDAALTAELQALEQLALHQRQPEPEPEPEPKQEPEPEPEDGAADAAAAGASEDHTAGSGLAAAATAWETVWAATVLQRVVKAHQARNPRPSMPFDSLDSDSEELRLSIAAAAAATAADAVATDGQQLSPVAEPAVDGGEEYSATPLWTESDDDDAADDDSRSSNKSRRTARTPGSRRSIAGTAAGTGCSDYSSNQYEVKEAEILF
jgi:hypothetical protein